MKAIFPTDSHKVGRASRWYSVFSIKTLEVNEETLLSMYLVVRPSSSYFKIGRICKQEDNTFIDKTLVFHIIYTFQFQITAFEIKTRDRSRVIARTHWLVKPTYEHYRVDSPTLSPF